MPIAGTGTATADHPDDHCRPGIDKEGETFAVREHHEHENLEGMSAICYIHNLFYDHRIHSRYNIQMEPEDRELIVSYDDAVSPADIQRVSDDFSVMIDGIEQSASLENHIEVTYRYRHL